ncbi:MAG: hypothetical protein U9O85_04415 [Euryarchaeota archaeon]|nr:hypothetical protein [Euryarchaeota archaeon]
MLSKLNVYLKFIRYDYVEMKLKDEGKFGYATLSTMPPCPTLIH